MNHSSDPPLYFRQFVGVPLVNTHPSSRTAFFCVCDQNQNEKQRRQSLLVLAGQIHLSYTDNLSVQSNEQQKCQEISQVQTRSINRAG